MIQDLVKQFLGSGAASQATQELQQKHGMDPKQAQDAVNATAEGTAQAVSGDGGSGGGGLLGSLGGAGGALGMLGGALGGGGGSTAGLPPQMVDTVATFVASRTGLSPQHARSAVQVVLPKVMDFVKGHAGGGAKGKGGGLGGLFS